MKKLLCLCCCLLLSISGFGQQAYNLIPPPYTYLNAPPLTVFVVPLAGVNGNSNASVPIFTVPAGKTFNLVHSYAISTAVTIPIAGPIIVFEDGAAVDLTTSNSTPTAWTTVGKRALCAISAATYPPTVAGGGTVNVNVMTISTSATFVFTAYAVGFYLE